MRTVFEWFRQFWTRLEKIHSYSFINFLYVYLDRLKLISKMNSPCFWNSAPFVSIFLMNYNCLYSIILHSHEYARYYYYRIFFNNSVAFNFFKRLFCTLLAHKALLLYCEFNFFIDFTYLHIFNGEYNSIEKSGWITG